MHSSGYVTSRSLEHIAKTVSEIKRRFLDALAIEPRQRVLDVGCGPASDTLAMGRLTGSGGLVIGVDVDEDMIARGRERAYEAGYAAWVHHTQADAAALPFPDNYFQRCHSERLLQHVDDGPRVIAEMIRVTAPGGRLVVADTDWASLSVDTPEVDIERRVAGGIARMVKNGFAGRELLRRFTEQGLKDIKLSIHPLVWRDWQDFQSTSLAMANLPVELIAAGVVSAEEWQRHIHSLETAQAQGCFFATGHMVLVVGGKPRKT
jgi:ubiquinone/menaquinone biosynthesis C-methylase UbiE